jgi:hypothetical protein
MKSNGMVGMWKKGVGGWFGESSRHSLASKGVKTGKKIGLPVYGIDYSRIPALTLSGGALSKFGGKKAVKEYRVWVHPKGGGDDYYYSFKVEADIPSIRRALAGEAKKGNKIEKTLAVVWDKKNKRYREVVIDYPMKKERLQFAKPEIKGIKNMSDKELKEQLSEVRYHIKNFSSGTSEFEYQKELIEELKKRKINFAKPEIKGQQLRVRVMSPKKCVGRYGTQDVGKKGRLQRVGCVTKKGWSSQSWRLNLSTYKNKAEAVKDLLSIKGLSSKKRGQALGEINKYFRGR